MNPLKRLALPIILITIVFCIGVAGYVIFEQWPILDACYMVIITLFTVGFAEVYPLSAGGKIFTIFLIVTGVSTVLYLVGKMVEILVEGEIFGYRRKMRMEKTVAAMKNHYIICGYGRVGKQVAKELRKEKINVVVIDNKPEMEQKFLDEGMHYVFGDVSSDEVLEKAGVREAKGLIAAVDSDSENVFVTLSARVLNPHLNIIARSSSKQTEQKLKKAGASKVISPYFIAGQRMASIITNPIAVDFLDIILFEKSDLKLGIREIVISGDAKIVNTSLGDINVRKRCGALVLTVHKKNGEYVLSPSAETIFEEGDKIIGFGTTEQLNSLEEVVGK